jgi:hypothetical protein
MQSVQFQTEIGPDGVLNFSIQLGQSEAKMPVVVTIQPLAEEAGKNSTRETEWHEFVERTYGSCAGLGLEEPEDLPPPACNI